ARLRAPPAPARSHDAEPLRLLSGDGRGKSEAHRRERQAWAIALLALAAELHRERGAHLELEHVVLRRGDAARCCDAGTPHEAPPGGQMRLIAGPPVENANSRVPPTGRPSSAATPARRRNTQRTPAGRSRAKS